MKGVGGWATVSLGQLVSAFWTAPATCHPHLGEVELGVEEVQAVLARLQTILALRTARPQLVDHHSRGTHAAALDARRGAWACPGGGYAQASRWPLLPLLLLLRAHLLRCRFLVPRLRGDVNRAHVRAHVDVRGDQVGAAGGMRRLGWGKG